MSSDACEPMKQMNQRPPVVGSLAKIGILWGSVNFWQPARHSWEKFLGETRKHGKEAEHGARCGLIRRMEMAVRNHHYILKLNGVTMSLTVLEWMAKPTDLRKRCQKTRTGTQSARMGKPQPPAAHWLGPMNQKSRGYCRGCDLHGF